MNIVVENLTKKYGPQRAVDNISFEVKTGEILGFLGPNGAGKTTTMKIITAYMAPSDGNVFIGGDSVLEKADELKKKIGYLPESNPLYYDMPVLEYLEFVAELQGVPKNKMNSRIGEMVRVCGLNVEKHKKIGELSKGYKQRVGLAQAMIHDPEILILDEPTTGLDPNQIVEIRKLIKEIGREKTVILSTHILPEVEATCDRILIINNGKIVADGTSEMLRKQSQGQEILRVQISEAPGTDEITSSLQSLESVAMVDLVNDAENTFIINSKENSTSRKSIFQLCVDKNWVLTELTPIETKLEDIFRQLTTN
ncbi:MAG: ATP-binding cassette domain-containing protein [Melioribacteraceae bacterium]|nr:ATP-binding cassette domain-containing protein [Melioribacteraceae bacterium]MCF8355788.1 ATP-binding cassette domain-containing protein [Melioribacteraceae bacterium]MCF8392822.1 ATP-binding cassette domain-containing protein [Melioribacteraceae bacterium]MCF8418692.1 ATP-binding cassette domain-containing protein [Melioribacteraceae bacterium]